MTTKAVGIDIGGTGIKGAIVDVESGELVTDRIKKPTPAGGEPDAIVAVVKEIIEELGDDATELHVGVCFPAAIMDGKTLSAANVSKKWIDFEAEKLFESTLGKPIHFVNDADAAGYAESQFGAAKGVAGLVIMTTLGTGIGTALIHDGVLIVNAELGHLEIEGKDYETKASFAAKERDDLSWKHWAKRLQKYYSRLEALLYPRLIIVGGGVSKHYDEFLPLLDLRAEIVPAKLRNNAGILGAAALAAESKPSF
ncbi:MULTISPECIES: polyphosphate--glucose phosphotransferase [unclassified Frondihabitans]|jgi:polyphosphate glucokinase|uniref:polyphosphate--glucose phosphotransferase n=1 Tax=unclassified Frondihabitans TaxID=2626248 RepID=UPI0006F2823E|nr:MULTISPECIES: ROK family protein [unclassified Frondihabitans]KQQ27583.1 polyphosphate glucokinase [Frondihabitans sp. Leaf304]RPE75217.1 polyphosphate glucokinase [Frondihabitans sp. PhB153]RPF04459.1 polyphosphate glucokinase [Frondihabitans sp. PhB161]